MPHRTSLILDEETDRAARELALHFKFSSAEAIRRSVVGYRDLTLGARPDLSLEAVAQPERRPKRRA